MCVFACTYVLCILDYISIYIYMCVCLCIYIWSRKFGKIGLDPFILWFHGGQKHRELPLGFFHFCFTPSVGSRGGNSWPDIHITWHQTKSEDEIDMSTTKDNSLLKLVFVVPCQVAMDFIWVKTR